LAEEIMQVMFFFTIIAIVFTYSRGAFLGLAVILSVLIWRSPWRVRFAMFLLVATFISIPFLPSQLSDRINSIGEQESEETRDGSVQGRFEAWRAAWNIAVERPFTAPASGHCGTRRFGSPTPEGRPSVRYEMPIASTLSYSKSTVSWDSASIF